MALKAPTVLNGALVVAGGEGIGNKSYLCAVPITVGGNLKVTGSVAITGNEVITGNENVGGILDITNLTQQFHCAF